MAAYFIVNTTIFSGPDYTTSRDVTRPCPPASMRETAGLQAEELGALGCRFRLVAPELTHHFRTRDHRATVLLRLAVQFMRLQVSPQAPSFQPGAIAVSSYPEPGTDAECADRSRTTPVLRVGDVVAPLQLER